MKVPLYQDFRPLIDRITARMSSWMSKNLSFAGRLQLLQSVLYNIQFFWVGMGCSHHLKRSLRLLNKSSTNFCGMVLIKQQKMPTFLGKNIFVLKEGGLGLKERSGIR